VIGFKKIDTVWRWQLLILISVGLFYRVGNWKRRVSCRAANRLFVPSFMASNGMIAFNNAKDSSPVTKSNIVCNGWPSSSVQMFDEVGFIFLCWRPGSFSSFRIHRILNVLEFGLFERVSCFATDFHRFAAIIAILRKAKLACDNELGWRDILGQEDEKPCFGRYWIFLFGWIYLYKKNGSEPFSETV